MRDLGLWRGLITPPGHTLNEQFLLQHSNSTGWVAPCHGLFCPIVSNNMAPNLEEGGLVKEKSCEEVSDSYVLHEVVKVRRGCEKEYLLPHL